MLFVRPVVQKILQLKRKWKKKKERKRWKYHV